MLGYKPKFEPRAVKPPKVHTTCDDFGLEEIGNATFSTHGEDNGAACKHHFNCKNFKFRYCRKT